jgi:hypothetical protein
VAQNKSGQLENENLEGKLFSLQEKKELPHGGLEYDFPAVNAKLIRISPKSKYSCFLGSKVSSVSFVSQ